jgi:hypothetical protein
LPSQFVPAVLKRGDLLFRNLSYFRQIEERGRRDLLEGLHRDYPDTPITIDFIGQDLRWEGRASFLNCVNADRLLVFCLSLELRQNLFAEFSCDACIQFNEPVEFVRRCAMAVGKQSRFAESGLLSGPVVYYAPNRNLDADIHDPKVVPFCKHELYSYQNEFRLAVALRGGLKLHQHIVNEEYSFEEEAQKGRPDHRHVFVGPLADIATVHVPR